MALDRLAETRQRSPNGHQNPDYGRNSERSARRRWLTGGLLVIGGGTILVWASSLLPGAATSLQIGPEQLHRVTRGDLIVTITEQGTLESSGNTEIKCRVRGDNTVIWVIESGTEVQPGDELVRLETLFIEEEISERTKYAHLARSEAERARADVARSEIAISEYEEGRFVSGLALLEKDLAITESELRTAQNMLAHAQMMSESGYVSELEIEEKEFAVTRAKLDVELKNTEIDVLKRFTKAMELETLKGDLNAAKAKYEADKERAYADEQRLARAEEELQHCIVKAPRGGMVIHPSAAQWEDAPEIAEGATVHKDQVLLLMPDLSKMQVKVGIHESIIGRIRPGLAAAVALPDKTLVGQVSSVASVTRPAGWWTGNVVKYDTIVELPSAEGLKPGMTAEVEVIMAEHRDVVMIPLKAVVETEHDYRCWVRAAGGLQPRPIEIGDNNEMFVIVEAGVKEGEEVVIDPLAFIEEAQTAAAKTLGETKRQRQTQAILTKPPQPAGGQSTAEIDDVN